MVLLHSRSPILPCVKFIFVLLLYSFLSLHWSPTINVRMFFFLSMSKIWFEGRKLNRQTSMYVGNLCNGQWPVGWTIFMSGYAKLVQWLSMWYHVSYEPGSIGLLRSKAVSMTTLWQAVWQLYRQSNGARSSAVMDAVQCIKQILKVKLTGYIVIKTMYKWPSLTPRTNSSSFNSQTEPQFSHSLMYTLLHFAIHSFTHSHLLTWPLLATLNSAPWQMGGYHVSLWVLVLHLRTLNSATWQH